ncbi:GDSL esterase/lipase [Platanthera guangdongensis]|uniref:GDSL esterase/lipase n=1 Tax=Platanthera guangdongensis TaxID=2320717 RepID=A0ABR2LZQ4_9ASPA
MRPKVVLFGDSITRESFSKGGWGAALAHHFSRTADVVLRGYNGYNTRWALKGANRAMHGTCADGEHPLVLTVFFGANDASLPDRSSGFQHVPLDEYQSNLRSIISFFKERWPTTKFLLITPPPIDEDGRRRNPFGGNLSGLSERTNTCTGAYARACIAVATEYNIPVIDIWSKMQQFSGWEKSFLCDGLHFTASGNGILFEEVVAKFKEMGVSIDNLPIDLPLFDKLDSYDPLKVAFAS